MKTLPSFFIGLAAFTAAFSSLPLHAQDATLPPLGQFSPEQDAPLTIKVQNCLVDVIVNIADKATGKTVFRKVMERREHHSFSLTHGLKAGAYQVSVVPANVEHWSIFHREFVREVELAKGEQQSVDIDFEEDRPADMAPLPTEEQIDRFCQGDIQALQDYLGEPNRVLLVYVYEKTLEPNKHGNGKMQKLYGLVERSQMTVMQSTDPNFKAGERLEMGRARETGPQVDAELERFKASPFKPTLMYIINPIKYSEGKLHGDSGWNMFPMEKRSRYFYLRASHQIQGIAP